MGWDLMRGRHVLGGRGREAGVHVGAVSARGAHREVRIRTIDRDTRVWVAWRDQGGVVRGGGRGGTGGVLGVRLAVLEVGDGRWAIDLDSLARANVLDADEGVTGDMSLEEGVAEGDLALDELGVSSGGEGLPVSVLLLAGHAGGRTGGTLWMF